MLDTDRQNTYRSDKRIFFFSSFSFFCRANLLASTSPVGRPVVGCHIPLFFLSVPAIDCKYHEHDPKDPQKITYYTKKKIEDCDASAMFLLGFSHAHGCILWWFRMYVSMMDITLRRTRVLHLTSVHHPPKKSQAKKGKTDFFVSVQLVWNLQIYWGRFLLCIQEMFWGKKKKTTFGVWKRQLRIALDGSFAQE